MAVSRVFHNHYRDVDSLAQYITWRAAFLCAMHNEICTPGDAVLLDCAHNLVKYELILHQGYTI